MIKHQEEKYNWKIVFLGASLDAANQGASIGVKAMNMMHYSQTSQGNAAMYKSVSRGITKLRNAVEADYMAMSAFELEDKKEQEEILKSTGGQ